MVKIISESQIISQFWEILFPLFVCIILVLGASWCLDEGFCQEAESFVFQPEYASAHKLAVILERIQIKASK